MYRYSNTFLALYLYLYSSTKILYRPQHCHVPSRLKIAKVSPVYKTGDSKCFNNYRPISLLPVFSKLLEKIVYKRMMKFLDKHKILYNHQYGFRSAHNTEHPVLQLLKSVSEASDKKDKEPTLAIFS